jgi:hypothetical protein
MVRVELSDEPSKKEDGKMSLDWNHLVDLDSNVYVELRGPNVEPA